MSLLTNVPTLSQKRIMAGLPTTTLLFPLLLATLILAISRSSATPDPPSFFRPPNHHQRPLANGHDRRPVIGPERIAVIGAGPGGSSFAYYASRAFPRAQIDVYERSDRPGGRCLSERLVVSERLGLEIMVESGASIFVEENQNLLRAAREFDLTIGDDDDHLLDVGNSTHAASTFQVSIWNGTHTLFTLDLDGGWRSKFRGFWRYGFGPLTTGRLADAAAAKMAQVYMPGHRSYKRVDELVDGLGLRKEMRLSMSEYVERMGINKRWADEIVEGVTRVNYGRDLNEVHVLAGLAGFVKGPTYSVREGNQRIYEHFLARSKARTYFNSTITAIHSSSASTVNGYQLTYTNTSTGLPTNSTAHYDTIVLALPPTSIANSALSLPTNSSPIAATPYHQVHVTFVLGKLNRATFPNRPVQVLTTKSVKFVQSVSLVRDFGYQLADHGVGLYKVFSTVRLADSDPKMRQLFARVDKVWRREWLAYPVMRPERKDDMAFYAPLTVHEMPLRKDWQRKARVFYLNGMERVMSTMETATVASRNLVRLLVDEVLDEDGATVSVARN